MRGTKVALAAMTLLLALLPSRGQAQVEILWTAGSFLANKAIADSQNRTIASCKLVFNVAVVGRDGLPRHMGVWDPSNNLAVWFGDNVELEVVPLKNGPPSDFTLFVNDKLWAYRKVRPGKVEYGKLVGAKGVEGDYPRLRVRELRTGVNQIKVVFRRGEWASAQIQQLSLESFLHNINEEGNLQQIAGAGQAMYPATPAFTALFPDGRARAFRSAQEAEAAIKGLNRPKEPEGQSLPAESPKREVEQPKPEPVRTEPVREPPPPLRQEEPKREESKAERVELLPVDVRAMPYELSQAQRVGAGFGATLLDNLRRVRPLPPDAEQLAIYDGEGLALLVSSRQPFTVTLLEQDGREVLARGSTRVNGREELMIRLSFDKNEPSRRFVIEQNNRRRELNFQRQGRETNDR